MVFEEHNDAIFTKSLVWEIRFKNPNAAVLSPVHSGLKEEMEKLLVPPEKQDPPKSPMLLNPESEKHAAIFLEKFAEICEIVTKEKLLEKEKLAELIEISEEELEEKTGILQKNIDSLTDLVAKFKEMMKKFDINKEREE